MNNNDNIHQQPIQVVFLAQSPVVMTPLAGAKVFRGHALGWYIDRLRPSSCPLNRPASATLWQQSGLARAAWRAHAARPLIGAAALASVWWQSSSGGLKMDRKCANSETAAQA